MNCNGCDSEAADLTLGGTAYCDAECAEGDGWTQCFACEDWTDNDGFREVEGTLYCDGCFDRRFYECESCGTVEPQSFKREGSGDALCEQCFFDCYAYCYSCGEVVDLSDAFHYDDEVYCSGCNPNAYEGCNYTEITTFDKVGKRRFGIELEYNDAAGAHEHRYFGRGFDHCGIEYRSGILEGDGGLEASREFVDYSEREGWTIGYDCGYHLHVDLTDLSLDQLKSVVRAYNLTHALWEGCVDPTRDETDYCRFGKHDLSTLSDVTSKAAFAVWGRHTGRYNFINWSAYTYHKTVEIRGHHATLDSDEVCNWVTAHTRFVDFVKDCSESDLANLFYGSEAQASWSEIIGSDVCEFYRCQKESFQPIAV